MVKTHDVIRIALYFNEELLRFTFSIVNFIWLSFVLPNKMFAHVVYIKIFLAIEGLILFLYFDEGEISRYT